MRRALPLVTLVLLACSSAPRTVAKPASPVLPADVRACDAGQLLQCLRIPRRVALGLPAETPEAGALRARWQIGCDAGHATDCYRTAVVVSPAVEPGRWIALLDRACDGDVGLGCYLLGDAMLGSAPRHRARALDLLQRSCQLGLATACERAACHQAGGECTQQGRVE